MAQQEINQNEWSKPENWSGPKLLGFYSSKKDTRLWVPKRIPSFGWTINFGNRWGAALFAVILMGIAGLLVFTCLLGLWKAAH